MRSQTALLAAVTCVSVLCLAGCAATPQQLLVDVSSSDHLDDHSDPSRKATPCEFTGGASFLAERPMATLISDDGRTLGHARLAPPYVGVGGFCETILEYEHVPNAASYRILVGGRSVTLRMQEAERVDGEVDVSAWDVFASDFR